MSALASRLAKLDPTLTGIVLIVVVSFIWALMEIITSYASQTYSLYQVVWVRYAVHLLFMLLVFAPRQGLRLVTTHRLGLQIGRGLMMLAMPVSFILAVDHMPTGNILSIFWLAPLMIMLLSLLLMKEGAAWYYWVLMLVGFGCILVITRPTGSGTVWGLILSLVMGLSFSLYVVMTRMLREEPTLTNLFYTAVSVLIPLAFKLPGVWRPLNLPGVLMMAAIGMLGFALLWVLDKAMEMTSAAVVAPFIYSQMAWTIILRLVLRVL